MSTATATRPARTNRTDHTAKKNTRKVSPAKTAVKRIAKPVAPPATPVPTGRLDERAMLVHLSIGFWTGQQKDQTKTDEVLTGAGAEGDAGQWWTRVIPKSATKAVLNARLKARVTHLEYTLPWQDDGFRVLPAAMYMRYTAAMRAHREEYRLAVDAFLAEYPQYVTDAATRLGSLFRTEMLPAPAEIAGKYPFALKFNPLPSADDFRVDLGADRTAEIRESIEANNRAAMDNAMGDLWNRLHAVIENVVTRLADPEGIFRDSLIKNAVELCDLLPQMNVTQNSELEEARQAIMDKLSKQEPAVLRKNPAVRADAAKAASDILAKIEQFRPAK